MADKPYIVPGRVYNIVTCADRTEINNNDGGDYAEEHESNNCTDEMVFEVEGIYNFSLSTLTLAGNQLDAGTMLQATVNVASTQDPPNEDVPVAIFLSPNQDWNNRWLADTFLIPWSELQGGFASRTRNIAVPMSPGAYTLWTCVNPNGSIPETIGEDNCQSLWFEVLDVAPQPQPDGEEDDAIITIIQMMM